MNRINKSTERQPEAQPGRQRSPRKAACAADCRALEEIPNIGPAIAANLRQLGILWPADLATRDAWALYESLCHQTSCYHDPCVLDTFLAATAFMRGAPAQPWWHYTPERQERYGQALVAMHLAIARPSGLPH